MKIKKLFLPVFLLSLTKVQAHCPLCTIGAGAAAGFASYLGVSNLVIGVFMGAFAASMGWWFSRILKKQFIPYQKAVLVLLSFLTTIIPLITLMKDVFPIYLLWFGEYGTLFNRTYVFNQFFIGSLLGLFVISITPHISSAITKKRGKTIPYQGIALTFSLLIISSILLEVVI